MNTNEALTIAINAALKAGKKILNYYNQSVEIFLKADLSPLTIADKESQEIILNYLSTTPFPIISEEMENVSFQERQKWDYCWIVDPLDGTKEFINKNGEFTVNIALVHNHTPILGVVYAPAIGHLYFASKDIGSYKIMIENDDLNLNTLISLPVKQNSRSLKVVVSRSHSDIQTEAFIIALKEKHDHVEKLIGGSALKMCKVAEGIAHLYPRFGKTMEWDTAAGHAILKYSNANLFEMNTMQELKYNKDKLENPNFIAIQKNIEL
ncbi:MAG: 3'(2'),5'-bisphosphate nucleotidase CysQ [Bacteroidales bacterium]